MGRGQEGAPLLDQLAERRDDRGVATAILAERRLVEGQEERPPGEGGDEREPALLAAGESVRAPVPELLERKVQPLAQSMRMRDQLRRVAARYP